MDIDNFKKELRQLLIKYGVTIGVDIDGDTHGINTNFIVANSNRNETYILNYYSSYLDSYDLK